MCFYFIHGLLNVYAIFELDAESGSGLGIFIRNLAKTVLGQYHAIYIRFKQTSHIGKDAGNAVFPAGTIRLCDGYGIASRKALVNVKDLVEHAKANGSKIVVTGYADSKTGSAAYNQQLSQKRADVVANELVKMGVNRDNIEVVAAGGVNNISPYSYNRRVTIQVK